MVESDGRVPGTLAEVLEPAWLSGVLGREVAAARQVELIRTVATKVRFAVEFADGGRGAYCLKGLLDADPLTARGGPTMVREADFYGLVAGRVDVRVPTAVATVVDREGQQAVVLMRDLIADGARFCSALEPFTADDAAASLEQLARLHAGAGLLAANGWIGRRIDAFAEAPHLTPAQLQELLDGPRGAPLAPATRDAGRLIAGLKVLAGRDAGRPQFLVHGDAHAGNVFRAEAGPGLIDWQLLQRGGWALDVAYHLCAVLPVELAATEERRLLAGYLAEMRALGCAMPGEEEAFAMYREAVVYGLYLWAITRRVEPAIIETFVPRLGLAAERLGSFAALGVD